MVGKISETERRKTKRFKFTKKALDALPWPKPGPGKKDRRDTYYDTAMPSLRLRVTSAGAMSFSVHRRVKRAETSTVTIGTYPDMSIDVARDEAEKLGGQYAQGINPAKLRKRERDELTLRGLFEEYLDYKINVDGMKRPEKKRELFELYLAHWANRKIRSITSADVSAWFKELPAKILKSRAARRKALEKKAAAEGRSLPKSASPNKQALTGKPTANQALKLLRAMYRVAIDNLEIYEGRVPASKLGLYKEEPRERFIRKGEMPAFIKAVFEEPNTDVRDYVLVSLLTGARRANVCAMKWEDLVLTKGAGEWTIRKAEAKAGKTINLPIVDAVVEMLLDRKRTMQSQVIEAPPQPVLEQRYGKRKQQMIEASARRQERASKYVFPGVGKKGHMVEPKNVWTNILVRSGLSNLKLHDLRRTLGSWQAAMGANLRIIQDSLSHQNLDSTMPYMWLDLDPVRESLARTTAAMFAAAMPEDPGADVLPIKKAA